jgi:hypothetical protein
MSNNERGEIMATPPNKSTEVADKNVERILAEHPEALVIYTDPDPDATGESNISAFMKLEDQGGHLSAYLTRLLQQLLRDQHAKRGGIKDQAAISP